MAPAPFEVSDEEAAPANRPFPILDLPAELRNNVFAKVIEDQPEAFLTSRTRYKLASRSSLPRVSRQIREEFLALLFVSADIVTDVCDFNFSHVITFFNRLRDAELKTLPTNEAISTRQITVRLVLKASGFSMNYSRLLRWLNRIQHPTKKGANVNVSYVVQRWPYGGRPGWIHSTRKLKADAATLPVGRKKEEFEKIVEALVKKFPS